MTRSVAVYRRRVAASELRVWENVLDWEHLPWLHRHAFRSLERLETERPGWRVRTALAGGDEIVVELETFREASRYVVRTIEGAGQGTEIWTQVAAVAPRATDVEVAFHVPALVPEARDPVGRGYVALYTRLWDEDEAMMVRRQEVLDRGLLRARPAPGAGLGSAAELRASAPRVVEAQGVPLRVVLVDGELWAHSFVCPHRGGPLQETTDDPTCVRCPWHGYRFDVRSGRSADGRVPALAYARRLEIDARGEARLPAE